MRCPRMACLPHRGLRGVPGCCPRRVPGRAGRFVPGPG
jgi:hypothetical protein